MHIGWVTHRLLAPNFELEMRPFSGPNAFFLGLPLAGWGWQGEMREDRSPFAASPPVMQGAEERAPRSSCGAGLGPGLGGTGRAGTALSHCGWK